MTQDAISFKEFQEDNVDCVKMCFCFSFLLWRWERIKKKKKIWKKGPSSCWQLLATVIDAGLCVCSPNPILVDEPYEETEREKWDRLARDLTRKTLYSIGFDDLFLPLKMMMMMITFTSRPGKPSHTQVANSFYSFLSFFLSHFPKYGQFIYERPFPPFFFSFFLLAK